jgi:hypothetical protein
VSAADLAEDRRLATLHLRLGELALARAELEDLHRRAALDAPGLADLAEARWRSGDLHAAEAAARDHLAAGGSRPIARAIAAEAATAAGRPGEARVHVEALGPMDAEALEHLFAGMPRRAFWPSAPNAPIEPPATMFGLDRARGPGRGRPAAERLTAAPSPHADAPPPVDHPQMARLWTDDEPSLVDPGVAARRRPAAPAEELARGREEMASGDPAASARGLVRLSLVLRLYPALAADVLGALGHGRDAATMVVRGDACRLLGRTLEAEAAFAAAARALDDPARPARPSRPSRPS